VCRRQVSLHERADVSAATASGFRIRPASDADATALLAIYAPFVEHTTISFEATPPSVEEFAARIRSSQSGWAWLVAERDEGLLGYAYATSHRARAAYRWSVEVSAYVEPRFQRMGVASALYAALFEALVARGYCNAFAGVALPNDASIALHRRVGFEPIGVFRSIGWKFAAWHDVAWFQRRLRDGPPEFAADAP
jgi:L-amino acid N-acyltransferase YncA